MSRNDPVQYESGTLNGTGSRIIIHNGTNGVQEEEEEEEEEDSIAVNPTELSRLLVAYQHYGVHVC